VSSTLAAEKVIFDTDIGGDIDDAGAMAVLHTLMRRDDIQLLAIGVVNGHVNTVPYVDAINTFFGHPDLPIGTLKGAGPYDRDRHMGSIVRTLTRAKACEWMYQLLTIR
jgi:hypothetical protein